MFLKGQCDTVKQKAFFIAFTVLQVNLAAILGAVLQSSWNKTKTFVVPADTFYDQHLRVKMK